MNPGSCTSPADPGAEAPPPNVPLEFCASEGHTLAEAEVELPRVNSGSAREFLVCLHEIYLVGTSPESDGSAWRGHHRPGTESSRQAEAASDGREERAADRRDS